MGTPDIYLGAQIYQHSLLDGQKAWGMSSERYVRRSIETVEGLLKEDRDGYHLKSTAREPVPLSYKPELDVSPELDPKLASRYHQMVGILRWAVELGQVNIYYETAILSHYLVCPRKGHLEALYHIFAYLKSHQLVEFWGLPP